MLSDNLLKQAEALIRRPEGSKGRVEQAAIRRSISTTYYALFHFIINRATRRIVGTRNEHAQQRNILARRFEHAALKRVMFEVASPSLKKSSATFLGVANHLGRAPAPAFARELGAVFADAQSKRHEADYDLNARLTLSDAQALIERARAAIAAWESAADQNDRDFKHLFAIYMLIQGKVGE
jgi:uncharacterized protein (UPF0332 family)